MILRVNNEIIGECGMVYNQSKYGSDLYLSNLGNKEMKYFFLRWIDKVFESNSGRINYKSEYIKNIELINPKDRKKYTFYGCSPQSVSIDEISFDNFDNFEDFKVTIRADYWDFDSYDDDIETQNYEEWVEE